ASSIAANTVYPGAVVAGNYANISISGSNVSGGSFGAVNGSALTNLNASALASGTVGSGLLPSTVAYTNIANTFSAAQTVNGSSLTVTGKDAATGYRLSLS